VADLLRHVCLKATASLRVWRIADARHPIFDGGGALLFDGRWHTRGRKVIYCAASFAGAMLEIIARLPFPRGPASHHSVSCNVPDEAIELVDETAVPGWDADDRVASQAFGNAWYDSARTLALAVPSVIARHDRNVLLNQMHPAFAALQATAPEPVIWDPRLIGR
jgi:RES domain-containing protein